MAQDSDVIPYKAIHNLTITPHKEDNIVLSHIIFLSSEVTKEMSTVSLIAHPKLQLPFDAITHLLPAPALSVLQLLDFSLPTIQSGDATIPPEAFFHHVSPNLLDMAEIKTIPIPPINVLENLIKQHQQFLDNGAQSIRSAHMSGVHTLCLPLWVIHYWLEVVTLCTSYIIPWRCAEENLQKMSQAWKGDNAAESRKLVRQVYSSLDSLLWSRNIEGFSGQDPIVNLHAYATNNWLSDIHENQMLDLLRQWLYQQQSGRQLLVKNTFFINYLQKAYESRATGKYKDSKCFINLRETGLSLISGAQTCVGFVANINNSHWISVVLDFTSHIIYYGDSLGDGIENKLAAMLK